MTIQAYLHETNSVFFVIINTMKWFQDIWLADVGATLAWGGLPNPLYYSAGRYPTWALIIREQMP